MNQYGQNPADGGMLYTETDLSKSFPEPLNTLTSCLFLVVAVYWVFKIKNNYRYYSFLSYLLLLLFIGSIGGTLYHGLRKWPVFIMMDWLPIVVICISTGVYFFAKVTKWFYSLLIIGIYVAFAIFLQMQFKDSDKQLFINFNYAFMGVFVLIPIIGYLVKTEWENGKWVGFALISFLFALLFRIGDNWNLLNLGTHFIWHIFGAVTCFCMLKYLFLVRGKRVKTK